MTKQTEALKLALEALEQLQGGCTDHNDGTVEAITVWCPEVITAIREALAEQPAQQEPWGACVYGRVFVGRLPEHARKFSEDKGVPIQWLYTSPPAQRKPLTDKEIDSFRETNSEGRGAGWRFNFKGFARAIEAAHGIKEKNT